VLAVGFLPAEPPAAPRPPGSSPSAFFSPLLVSLLRFNFLSPRWLPLQSLPAAAPAPQPTRTLRANAPPKQTRPTVNAPPEQAGPTVNVHTGANTHLAASTHTAALRLPIGLLRLVSHAPMVSLPPARWRHRSAYHRHVGVIGPALVGLPFGTRPMAPLVVLQRAQWRYRAGARVGAPPPSQPHAAQPPHRTRRRFRSGPGCGGRYRPPRGKKDPRSRGGVRERGCLGGRAGMVRPWTLP
jgi:hypothetical protein